MRARQLAKTRPRMLSPPPIQPIHAFTIWMDLRRINGQRGEGALAMADRQDDECPFPSASDPGKAR